MPDLSLQVIRAEAAKDTLTPTVRLSVAIDNRPASETIHAVLLRCQVQIEATRRRYSRQEQEQLKDLFGEPERWGETLRPMIWANVSAAASAFSGSSTITLALPCTFDLHVNASRYFYSLEDGTVPITLLFSGTVFFQSRENRVQAAPISWNCEARFQFPVEVWKECMDLHYRNSAWLRLRRDIFDRLCDFKTQQGFATFDEALERLVEESVGAGLR